MNTKLGIEDIAKILYGATRSNLWHELNSLDESWRSLPPTRDWSNPYSLAKDEYMRMASAIHSHMYKTDFIADLTALLERHEAELTARDEWEGYSECGEDVRMRVYIPSLYSDTGEELRPSQNIDLGSAFP